MEKCKYCKDKELTCKGHVVLGVNKGGTAFASTIFNTWEIAQSHMQNQMRRFGNPEKWSIHDRSSDFQDRAADDHLKDTKLAKQKMDWLNEVKKTLKKK